MFLTYAAPRGHALIDRALYLPKSWTDRPGPVRGCRGSGQRRVRDQTRAGCSDDHPRGQAGVPAGWVAGDEVYGADPALRRTVREHGLGYVLQVAANRRVPTHAGPMRVDDAARMLPETAWQTYSVRAWQQRRSALFLGLDRPAARRRRRRHRAAPPTHPPQRCHRRTGLPALLQPRPVPLSTLVRVAGQRWRIEESFQAAKGLTGLDQHQVRRWTSWHRWTTLAMLAHAFLAVATAIERDHAPAPAGLIELTVNEFRRLFDAATTRRPNAPSTPCSPGPHGAEDTKPEPANATTDDEKHNDHDLRL